MRQGYVNRRCRKCGNTVGDRQRKCECGGEATWRFEVLVSPPGAPRKRVTKTGFGTKRQALSALSKLQGAVESGELVEPNKVTLKAFFFESWLPTVSRTLAPSTLRSYTDILRARVVPTLGSVPLQALTAAQLNGLYSKLGTDGRSNGGGPLAARTVRYTHTVIRKSLKDAARWGMVPRNVADLADPPKATKTRKWTTWSPGEIRCFLEHAEGDRLAPLWELAVNTGMRRGELLGLRWEDIDLEKGTVAIRRALVVVGYEVVISQTKTDRARVIALDPGMVAILKEWRRIQLEERMAWGPAYRDSGYLFTKEDGSELHPDRVSKLFDRLVASSDLPRIRFHDLRHTWATTALAAGVHPKIVAERLGHGSIQITLDTYSHVMPQQDRAAGELVANLYRAATQ